MQREKLVDWAESLAEHDAKSALIECVEYLIETESIRMGDLSPYWESCGEPLIEGQVIWND